jgi:hypothetical protein
LQKQASFSAEPGQTGFRRFGRWLQRPRWPWTRDSLQDLRKAGEQGGARFIVDFGPGRLRIRRHVLFICSPGGRLQSVLPLFVMSE